MHIGLLHSHTGLAYVLFLAALLNLVCALAPAGIKATITEDGQLVVSALTNVMHYAHLIILNAGRILILLGIGLFLFQRGWNNPSGFWWSWSCILLWLPVEVVARRFVRPELQYVYDGGKPSQRLLIGTGVQLLFVATIFGIMHAK